LLLFAELRAASLPIDPRYSFPEHLRALPASFSRRSNWFLFRAPAGWHLTPRGSRGVLFCNDTKQGMQTARNVYEHRHRSTMPVTRSFQFLTKERCRAPWRCAQTREIRSGWPPRSFTFLSTQKADASKRSRSRYKEACICRQNSRVWLACAGRAVRSNTHTCKLAN
jgi:hypothetical protein